ncbi:MAG TPA: ShlB/FhaC/HecB family hemolysin secretion/activation protein, partial [Sphingobium sp.]|nr:ShlB/FhaC/HecB family hemolysin secretion/activation protein [Sphingobium sp.]
APPAAAPAPAVSVTAPADPAASVALTRVRYMGASLPVALLDAAVAPLVGRPLTRDTLQAVAKAVGDAYARSDIAFYAVSIPAQIPAGGQLIVRVIEGRVKDYRLVGLSPSMPTRLIQAQMRRIMRDTPLRKSVLERSLGLLRDIPGQTVDAQVKQSGQPGELTLDLIVKRTQMRIGITIDNSGVSNVVDGVQAQLAVTVNGLLREGDSTRVAGYLPFYPDRYQYYALSHSTPIGSNGTGLTGQIAHVATRSRDGAIEGEATLAGVTVSHALIRSNRTNLSVSASLDGVDSSNYFLDLRFGDYRSRALRLGASWSRAEGQSGEAVSAVVSRGVKLLGAKPFVGFSESGFTKANVQAVAVRGLSKHLSLRLSARGQYSRDRLPVTERFSLGGRGAGMAFRLGTRTAEQAIAGAAELSWTLPAKAPPLKEAALFVYADGAVAHAVARPAYRLAAEDLSLASVGGGVRVAIGRQWRASAEIAVPVKRPDNGDGRKARLFFSLGRAF